MTETKEQVENLEEIDISDILNSKLIVINDDVNTFEHVIKTLMRVCQHTEEQAEQCAYIIHNSGKCVVKEGSKEKLKPYREALQEAHLTCEIQ